MRSTSAILLLAMAPVDALMPMVHVVRRAAAPTRLSASVVARYDDPILDDSLPDPVYDNTEPYKGRTPFGFNSFAESINGRVAMSGFTILFLQELIAGKGVLEQYG